MGGEGEEEMKGKFHSGCRELEEKDCMQVTVWVDFVKKIHSHIKQLEVDDIPWMVREENGWSCSGSSAKKRKWVKTDEKKQYAVFREQI